MVNPALRNYRIPAFADVPRTEVYFADTYDTIGPLGAKAQGECAINPVAPAISNALADATGVRFAHLPFTPDRIFDSLGGLSDGTGGAGLGDGRVTIVTQTAGAARRRGGVRASGRTNGGADRTLSRLSRHKVLPPSPPAQVDWVILQRFADRRRGGRLDELRPSGRARLAESAADAGRP